MPFPLLLKAACASFFGAHVLVRHGQASFEARALASVTAVELDSYPIAWTLLIPTLRSSRVGDNPT